MQLPSFTGNTVHYSTLAASTSSIQIFKFKYQSKNREGLVHICGFKLYILRCTTALATVFSFASKFCNSFLYLEGGYACVEL